MPCRFPTRRAENTRYKMLRTGEQRGVPQAVLDVDGREMLFLKTHIDHRPGDAERMLNTGELKEIVAAAGAMPVMRKGDFNATPDNRVIAAAGMFLTDTRTRVGHGPGLTVSVRVSQKRIDYVWTTPATVEPVAIRVPNAAASDHLPVVAECG